MFGRVKQPRRTTRANLRRNPYNCKSASPSKIRKMMRSVGDDMASNTR